jgi:ADP-ribosyl-[dinitrogen reductase] hydrolase
MIENRRMGALVGAVVGDLLGIPHEFSDPSAIPRDRLMPVGGGPFMFPPGVGSDDTDLLFAVLNAYDHRGEFDANLALDNMLSWLDGGPRDIGSQTLQALLHWSDEHPPPEDMTAQGNGGLMRAAAHGIMAPTVYKARVFAADDTSLTHPSKVAETCSELQAMMVWRIIHGHDCYHDKRQILSVPGSMGAPAQRNLRAYDVPCHEPSGHCVHSLRLAKYALSEAKSFEDGIDTVIRTGGDTDTNGAVAGALLGARFGEKGIPKDWRDGISAPLRDRIERVREKFKVKEAA